MAAPELRPRTTSVTIMQGDDIDTMADLQQAVRIAQQRVASTTANPRIGDTPDPSVAEALTQMNEFIESAADRAVVIELQALSKTAFRELVAQHPARKDAEGALLPDDAAYGVNVDTFASPFLAASATDAEIGEEWFDQLAEGDFDRCFDAAFWLNRSRSADPKELMRSTHSLS
jgi:hypothetical protein